MIEIIKNNLDEKLPDMIANAVIQIKPTQKEVQQINKLLSQNLDKDFRRNLLKYFMKKRQIFSELVSLRQLYAVSFFSENQIDIRQTIIPEIIDSMNKQIHQHFISCKDQIKELIQLEKKQQDEIKRREQYLKNKQQIDTINIDDTNYKTKCQRKIIEQLEYVISSGGVLKNQEQKFSEKNNTQLFGSYNKQNPLQQIQNTGINIEELQKKDGEIQGNTQNITNQQQQSQFMSFSPESDRTIIKNQFGESACFQNDNQECFCGFQNPQKITDRSIQCCYCKGWTHLKCIKQYKSVIIQNFICPKCTLYNIDPLNQIVKIIQQPLVFKPDQYNPKIEIKFNPSTTINKIEVRCIRIEDGQNLNGWSYPSWPDIGFGLLNGDKILDFQPLQSSYSVKRRHDENYIIKHYKNNQENILSIHEVIPNPIQLLKYRIRLNQTYIITIVEVKRQNIWQFINQIRNNSYNNVYPCNNLNANQIQQNQDLQLDSIILPLDCCFTKELIKFPARGEFCTHLQSFDLQNYLIIQNKNKQSNWRCPLCKKISFRIYIDFYQEKIINIIKQKNLNLSKVLVDHEYNIQQQQQQQQGKVIDQDIIKYLNQINEYETDINQEIQKKICFEQARSENLPIYID